MEGVNVMASGLPLFDENQGVIGCVAILRDITKSKVAEAQLEKNDAGTAKSGSTDGNRF